MPDWRARHLCDAIGGVQVEDAREAEGEGLDKQRLLSVPLLALRPAPLHLCPALIDGSPVEIPSEYAGVLTCCPFGVLTR